MHWLRSRLAALRWRFHLFESADDYFARKGLIKIAPGVWTDPRDPLAQDFIHGR